MLALYIGLLIGVVFSMIISGVMYQSVNRELSRLRSKLQEEQSTFNNLLSEMPNDELSKTKAGSELVSLLKTNDYEYKSLVHPRFRVLAKIFYHPAENRVGVIYSRRGDFKRFAHPDQWTVLSLLERVEKEVALGMRTAIVRLDNVLTRDQISMDIELKIFYSVDVRQVNADRLAEVLHFESESAWEEIVTTGITDIAHNYVVSSHTFDELTTSEGRAYLNQALSAELAQRVRTFGILVNRYAVSIMKLRSDNAFQEALEEVSAAKAIGSAAAEKIRPMLEQMKDQDQQKAFLTLLMQIAAAVAKTGESPDILFTDKDHSLDEVGGLSGRGKKQDKNQKSTGLENESGTLPVNG